MDVVGGFHLAGRRERAKAVSGIDDSSRFAVSATLVRRATAGPVCEALLAALRRHGVPEQILTTQREGLHRQVRPGWQLGGGVVRPGLRRERYPASVDRAPISDHHRECGAVAQDDSCRVPPRP